MLHVHRLSPSQLADALLPALVRRCEGSSRFMLGLTGPPGAGKSLLAASLVDAFNVTRSRSDAAAVVGMDGFHLPHADLARRGLADVKGAPDTFDAEEFISCLRQLRLAERPVTPPAFDRILEEPVAGSVTITPQHQLLLVEGNYLLLEDRWREVRSLLDEVWQLAVADDVRVVDLVARHVAHGRTPAEATEWVTRSDEANARRVKAASHRADAVVDRATGRLFMRSRGQA